MKIFGLILARVLGTLLVTGGLIYLGWWFIARHNNNPTFDTCLLGLVAFGISLYLFWDAFPRDRSTPIFEKVIREGNNDEVMHQLDAVFRRHGFAVRRSQGKDEIEASGKWWIFSEGIQATIRNQLDQEVLVSIKFDIKYLASFYGSTTIKCD